MKTLLIAVLMFTVTCTSWSAVNLPKKMPDDFFIRYEVKGADGGFPDFVFTASASGNATLNWHVERFDFPTFSVKHLYNAARNLWESSGSIPKAIKWTRKTYIVASGNEVTFLSNNESIIQNTEFGKLENVILTVIDENRPGWRDEGQ